MVHDQDIKWHITNIKEMTPFEYEILYGSSVLKHMQHAVYKNILANLSGLGEGRTSYDDELVEAFGSWLSHEVFSI